MGTYHPGTQNLLTKFNNSNHINLPQQGAFIQTTALVAARNISNRAGMEGKFTQELKPKEMWLWLGHESFPSPGNWGLAKESLFQRWGFIPCKQHLLSTKIQAVQEEQKRDGPGGSRDLSLGYSGQQWMEDLPVDTQHSVPPGDLAAGQRWCLLGKVRGCGHQTSGMSLKSSGL